MKRKDYQLLPINLKYNTDYNSFYDYFNFYFNDFGEKINVYIRKLYGEAEFYECNDSIDVKSPKILTTPISNCKNKKSIFNRILFLENSELFSGYLGHDAHFYIYMEDNNQNKIIKMHQLRSQLNSAAKYLRKDEEYIIDFFVHHLIKLEPSFNAEVSIYDNNGFKVILNSKNPTVKLEGINYKIRSSNDAMIYFYNKLYPTFKQYKIDPKQKGKNIRIKMDDNLKFWLDFGFEGYNPLDLSIQSEINPKNQGYIYIENIYDKLKSELVENEFLYLYILIDDFNSYVNYKDTIKIEYFSDNINNPNNEYTFTYIPKNKENKTLIINNGKNNKDSSFKKISYQIKFCKSHSNSNNVRMYYQGFSSNDETYIKFEDEES